MLVRVMSSGNLVAYDSISGDDQAFPAGTPITTQLEILPVDIADSLGIEVAIYSPAGDPTEIDTSDTLGITVPPATVQFSEATVTVGDVTIEPVTATLDFGGVDTTLVERIQSGALLVDVANPFSVAGALDVRLDGGFPAIQRSIAIREGTYADSVTLTGAELQSILGSESTDVVASGTLAATAGTVTVTPTQRAVLDTRLRMVVLIGPTED